MDGLNRLIKQNHIGSARQLALILGITPMAISQWRKRESIPSNYVMDLVDLSDPYIDPEEFNSAFKIKKHRAA